MAQIANRFKSNALTRNAALGIVLFGAIVPATHAGNEVFLQCAQKYPDNEIARLKCYDQAASGNTSGNTSEEQTNVSPAPAVPVSTATTAERSYLTRAWNLDDLSSTDVTRIGRLQPYRMNYLIIRKSAKPNEQPSSPLPDHNVLTPYDLDAGEAKFQISFKADVGSQQHIDFFGIETFRLWVAYTQQSYWQVFNTRNSSPFRETNYEPELIGTLGTGKLTGLKLVNIGLVHQSNGRPRPESRSWNRIYLEGGWEWSNNVSFLVRGWHRIAEKPSNDDNPDITDYVGKGDFVARWEPMDRSYSLSMLLRSNLDTDHNRGFMQVDWATPAKFGSAARIHVQITSGYGESLIDYNYRQTTFGLGFSFREW